MPTGSRPVITPADRLRWLEQLDAGQGITKIAKSARRDIRIVKRHIEVARQERESGLARRDFLRGRYEEHQQDLLDEAERIRKAVLSFPPGSLVAPSEGVPKKVHEAFLEHIRRTELWRQIHEYELELATYRQMRQDIQQALKERIEALTKQVHPSVRLHDWSQAAISLLEARLRSPSPDPVPKTELRSDPDEYWVIADAYSLMSDPIPLALTPEVQKAFGDFWPSAKAMLPAWQVVYGRLRQSAALIADEIDGFAVRHMVPNKCSYCPI